MKKILVIFIALITLFSCSVSDDTPRSHNEILPIESVTIPETFQRGQTYTIDLVYNKPTNCHRYSGIYYVSEDDGIKVAVISEVYSSNVDCQEIVTEAEASFNVRAENTESYVFKFWLGTNPDSLLDEYQVIEVPVVE